MLALFQKLFKEEEGQTLTEYGLILGLIALVVIVALTAFGTELNKIWVAIKTKLEGINTP